MNNLKKFYEDAEKNDELKAALMKANEEAKELDEKGVMDKIIQIAGQFGYEITARDFEPEEGELDEKELNQVSGGVSAGCFLANAGCTVIGEIGKDGGCFILGLY